MGNRQSAIGSRRGAESAAHSIETGPRRGEYAMAKLPYPLIDADNHYYETPDCFTRHIES